MQFHTGYILSQHFLLRVIDMYNYTVQFYLYFEVPSCASKTLNIPKGHKEFKIGTITGDYNLSMLVKKDEDGNPWKKDKIRILKCMGPSLTDISDCIKLLIVIAHL